MGVGNGSVQSSMGVIGSALTSPSRPDLLPRDPERLDVLPGHARDVRDGDLLRAHRLALAFVRAAAEALGIGLLDHRSHALIALDGALGQEREMGDLRAHEQVRRRVLAGGDTRATADARRRVHRGFGGLLGNRDRVAVGRPAAVDRDVAPAAMIRSNALRSTTRSLTTGNALARHGSTVTVSPSLNRRMCSWHTVVPRSGPCGMPLTTRLHIPQMPSRQSESKAMASFPWRTSPSLTTSSISRNDISGETS